MNRNLALVVVLGTTLATAVACGGDNSTEAAQSTATAETPPIDVAVVRATVGTLESALEISGTLTARTRVGVRPKLPGRLERVTVDVGDRVTQGQVLATIDRGEVDAQVDAAVATVNVAKAGRESAEASLANAVIELERARSLFAAGALPRQRLDGAQTAHRAAAAQRDLADASLAQAEASVRRAREVQRDTTLYSPITGFIVERHYDPGAIPSDNPVVVVADISQLKLEAGVSELEAGRLKRGSPAQVSVQARPGETFSGELVAIVPEVDQRNRHFQVEVRVANRQGTLLAGMYATSRIVLSSAEGAITVPREAIVTRDGTRVVLKVQGDKLVPTRVTEGLTDGVRVQVLSGLSANDEVLADARRQLAPDARVKAVLQTR